MVINSGAKIKDNSIVDPCATILQYKEIGENCIIDAVSVVIIDCIRKGASAERCRVKKIQF